MRDWICIHCGTTMSSKCPHQRNEFFSMDVAALRSSLMTHVLHVNGSHREVFLNLSDYSSQGDAVYDTVKYLSENLDKLKAVSCDHHFVLNSETERHCVLGCEHYNLSDKEVILAESGKRDPADLPTFEEVLSQYGDYVGTVLRRAAEDAKRLLPTLGPGDANYDNMRNRYFCFQDDMNRLGGHVRKMLDRLKRDEILDPKYRLTFGYKSERNDIRSDDLEHILRLARSYLADEVACTVYETVRKTTHHTEERLDFEKNKPLPSCDICGEAVLHGRVVFTEEDRLRHAKCQKKIDERYKHVVRTIKFDVNHDAVESHARFYNSLEDYFSRYLTDKAQRGEVEVLHAGYTKKGVSLRVRAFGGTIEHLRETLNN